MDYNKPDLLKARKRTGSETLNIDFKLDDKYKTIGSNKTYHIITFGCQGNEADSEVMAGILELMGFKQIDSEQADVLIINTCAVRENAEDRFYGTLGRLKGLKQINNDMIICICGCMAQEEKTITKLLEKYPQFDLVFGTHNIHMLPEYLYKKMNNDNRVIEVFSKEGDIIEKLPHLRVSNKKAWVNIMFGCDEFCTYCIVPYTRGKERSRRPKDIISEVEDLVKNGYLEVTLLGQNVNAYGKDFTDIDYTFSNLLNDLSATGIKRIRFTTSHPRDLDEATMIAMQKENVMPHLHLPVQSGSNSVLKKMNRKYTHEEYVEKIKRLKELNPGISITTDIIVAFPTETVEDFNETLRLCDEVGFEGAFTFIYSKREGTPAAKYPTDITIEEAHRRLDILHDKINAGYLKGNKRFEGTIVKVLVDGTSKNDPNTLCGYSEHNKLVNFKGKKESIGTIVNVKITEAKTWFLIGEEVE